MILSIFRRQIVIGESLTCPDLEDILSAAEAFAFDNDMKYERLSKRIILLGNQEYDLVIRRKKGLYRIVGIQR